MIDGFDLLTPAEKELTNRIVPLGWYYSYFSAFIERFEVQWGGSSSDNGFQSYIAALSAGIADLLAEYVKDVSLTEIANFVLASAIPRLRKVPAIQRQSIALNGAS